MRYIPLMLVVLLFGCAKEEAAAVKEKPVVRVVCATDNGKEFAKFEEIERQTGVKVYFAKPYHAWERGTNENRNGVVRKVLPKRSSFENLTEEELAKIDYMLNDRPMKCLNWRTPREAFEEILSRILR